MQQKHTDLDIDEVDFDHENPRIKMALEKYGDGINAERIAFALKTASSGKDHGAFNKLKEAIRAHDGILHPIIVVKQGEKKICRDGNTRLAIYKEFHKDNVPGEWKKISAILINDAEQLDIEKIRVSAHLVGAREWPAYEKARYLHDLYHQEFMGFAQMVALCGGNQKEIEQSIEAFNDMNEYYRDKLDNETRFQTDKFSGFVELQKGRIKEVIWKAGFELNDFGQWIHEGQIDKMADVRKLPKILDDPESKKIFVEGGIDSASRAWEHLQVKESKLKQDDSIFKNIQNASIEDLATALIDKLKNMTRSEFGEFRQEISSVDGNSVVDTLQVLNDEVQSFLDEASE